MTFTESLLSITANPFLLVLLILSAMYFARKPFHKAVYAFSLVLSNALRLFAASVRQAEKKLVERNREVLMAEGLENAERLVEREFDRINAAVVRRGKIVFVSETTFSLTFKFPYLGVIR